MSDQITCKNGHSTRHDEIRRQWTCDEGCAPISWQYAAANFLGPFAPKHSSWPRLPQIPGFVQVGPSTYERIATMTAEDRKMAAADAVRDAVRSVRKNGW